ncbi:SDR family oxidoreductase [Nannocystis sp. ILAH1]|uniref:SDR family oxidoreductase n=1 Tax=unclassified Nannocystis TaxID=2627009 RepID=UPI002271F35B|nr:SDR family oxidoreductase [Nannocystis sp. ILAH1]MCY1064693.1 SDR family oxidoreductase [Nannocystis sp. RBIL2]
MPLALVTGGAVRLGAATSKALAAAGFDVVVHTRRSLAEAEALVQALRDGGRQAWVAVADLADPDGPEELAAQVRRRGASLELLVNNAASYEHVAFEAITRERLEAMLAVNLRAPFLLTQALLPCLRAAAPGCVVNITDMAVSHPYTTTHAFSHYLASKAALEQLTRAWALELGPQVRVNAVAPGPVAMAGETTDEQRQDILRRTPLRREGSPEDIARAVVFLATAPYVTGQTLRVDGGLSVA